MKINCNFFFARDGTIFLFSFLHIKVMEIISREISNRPSKILFNFLGINSILIIYNTIVRIL